MFELTLISSNYFVRALMSLADIKSFMTLLFLEDGGPTYATKQMCEDKFTKGQSANAL